MYETILVPVDGSSGGEGAIARALALARVDDATVHALSVVETDDDLGDLDDDQRAAVHRSSERRARDANAAVADLAADVGVDAVRDVREGVAHREILAYADEIDADLIAMGTRGATPSTDVRLGSTTERVITFADAPVLSVRLGTSTVQSVEAVRTERVVVPVDGSDAAERAAEHALDLAENVGATVDVVYVIDETVYDLEDAPRSIIGLLREGGENAIETVELEARDRGLSVTADVLRGVPATEILGYADGVDADVIVMGTRGRAATSDQLLGSTTARVVRRSDHPVLTLG